MQRVEEEPELLADAWTLYTVAPLLAREAGDRVRAWQTRCSARPGTARHGHKRIVRSGANTLVPYRENPPDRVIGPDDVAFVDRRREFGGFHEQLLDLA
ncbi:hypothetical protein [Streptomyces luteolus]|uniref:hypothetical protein n=1 Tax=Streptomyces luteolus TaxID=3043615 RepID=UPI0038D22546